VTDPSAGAAGCPAGSGAALTAGTAGGGDGCGLPAGTDCGAPGGSGFPLSRPAGIGCGVVRSRPGEATPVPAAAGVDFRPGPESVAGARVGVPLRIVKPRGLAVGAAGMSEVSALTCSTPEPGTGS